MPVVLVSGFRQMGKDYFAGIFTTHDGRKISDMYDIYLRDGVDKAILDVFEHPPETYHRMAFAESLKRDIAQMLGTTVEFIDANKTTVVSELHLGLYPRELRKSATYRGVLINHAAWHRENDADYFVIKAIESFQAKIESEKIDRTIPVITDFRYPNEAKFATLLGRPYVSVRIHREGVHIPDRDDVSEHSLRCFHVDIILVPKGQTILDLLWDCVDLDRKYYKVEIGT
jgi:hypothetical protein